MTDSVKTFLDTIAAGIPEENLDVLTEPGDMTWEEEANFCADNATWAVDEIRFMRAQLRWIEEYDKDAALMARDYVNDKIAAGRQ